MNHLAFAQKCLERAYALLDEGPTQGKNEDGETIDLTQCISRSEGLLAVANAAINIANFEDHRIIAHGDKPEIQEELKR